jgi:glycosidase
MRNLTIYEINTATWLHKLNKGSAVPIDLSSIPDHEWDKIANAGFTAVWLMGIWQRSQKAIAINYADASFMQELRDVLPDLQDKDVIGSAYSVRSYSVNNLFGGNKALAVAKNELNKRGVKLLLDYVPNHVALDNPWVTQFPDYFVRGTQADLDEKPLEYTKIGDTVFALGRDPNCEPWSDVLQLNVFSHKLRTASKLILQNIAGLCDGVRCDMAMLVTNDIFKQTWQSQCGSVPQTEYWHDIITATRSINPHFIFIAEAYWGTQNQLLEQGFDYCYNKDFYDAIRDNNTSALSSYAKTDIDYQKRMLTFLENHDEPRAASYMTFNKHTASAIMLTTLPGAHLFYVGQLDGATVRTPVQLGRDPVLHRNTHIELFYHELFEALKGVGFNQATWQIYTTTIDNENADAIFAWGWKHSNRQYVTVINFLDTTVQTEILITGEYKLKKDCITQVFSNSHEPTNIECNDSKFTIQLQKYHAVILAIKD